MIAKTLLIFVTLILCVFSEASNYHQRKIYYGESDNCCISNQDDVVISINFNDRKKVEKTINGGTACNTWPIRYEDKILPANRMEYSQCYNNGKSNQYCDKLSFKQETTSQRYLDILVSIIQKVTILNPATFDKNQYTCVIDGDGAIQHFGPIGSIPAPRIEVNCKRMVANLQTQQAF